MILQKMPHYVDSILTQEDASAALQDGQVVVGLYTNRENVQSVVHSHPYYEMILPVAGSSVIEITARSNTLHGSRQNWRP